VVAAASSGSPTCSHRVRELVVFGAIAVAWVIAEAAATAPDRPAPRTLAAATAALLAIAHAGGVIEHVVRGAHPANAVVASGAALACAGIALRIWSIVALGPAFATRLDTPVLVTHGPYRYLRHPSEVGLTAAMLGGALILGSFVALAATVLAVPVAIARCAREDRALAPLRGPAERPYNRGGSRL
jgi:protein-S-isoprenylcysteine O-methyltransferase Ste14